MAEKVQDRKINTDAVDFTFGEIVNLHNDNEIVIQPEYQRLFRWSDEQKSRLIESILIELPIPPIFLIENEIGVLELIDGLQRVSSVLQFISADTINLEPLTLGGCDLMPELNGRKFEDLEMVQRLRVKRTPIRAIIIRKGGDQFIKYELFKRLNTGGSLLSPQEIRNCSSRMVEGGEKFYGFLKQLSDYENFKKSIVRLDENAQQQKGDEELVLRFFAVKNYTQGYKGNIKEWLDDYMDKVLFRKLEFSYDHEKKIFHEAFDIISEKFGGDAFVRYRDGQPQGRLAPAYFEAVVGAVARFPKQAGQQDAAELRAYLASTLESEHFRDVTGPGANAIYKLRRRIELVEQNVFGKQK